MTHLVCVSAEHSSQIQNSVYVCLGQFRSGWVDLILQKDNLLGTYIVFGHKSFRKLVCIKPGSRQPTVRAGEPISV